MLVNYLLLFLLGSINCLNLCGDWTQYKDIKCIKVIEKKASEEEALSNCTQIEKSSTLLTIHSKDEQEFLNNLLTKYKNISNNFWIGMKYINQSYQWIDGTKTNYTNWSDESVRDGNDPCVQISLSTSTFGKWKDESCKRKSMFVCQKSQELNLNSLRDIIENISIENQNLKNSFKQQQEQIEKQQKQFDKQQEQTEKQQKQIENQLKQIEKPQQFQMNKMIPLGFLYTQLPNQTSPHQLWPNVNWTEVTQQYAGLFFRAEGSGSKPFGQIQQANQSWISHTNAIGLRNPAELKNYGGIESVSLGGWSYRHDGYGLYEFDFFTTTAEVRPKNTAIKIWKRI